MKMIFTNIAENTKRDFPKYGDQFKKNSNYGDLLGKFCTFITNYVSLYDINQHFDWELTFFGIIN